MNTKRCSRCGETKPSADFYTGKGYKNGTDVYCIACRRRLARDDFAKNKANQTGASVTIAVLKAQGIERDDLASLIAEGHSMADIALQFGVSRGAIQRTCIAFDIPRRDNIAAIVATHARPISDNLFAAPLDSAQSWLLGLLMTDGAVGDDGRVRLALQDEGIARAAREIVGFGNVSVRNIKTCRAPVWLYEAGARHLATRLYTWGCTPRKTKTLAYPPTDQLCLPDFVRGLWDGDGCWSIDKRNNSLRATFGCASEPFITDLAKTLSGVVGKPLRVSFYAPRTFWNIGLNGSWAVALARWIYADNPLYAMERKRAIVAPFIQA